MDDQVPVEAFAALIGMRIAELRRSRGLTQAQLAKLMGVTQSAVGHVESPRRSERFVVPGLGVIAAYARTLGYDVSDVTSCLDACKTAELTLMESSQC